MSAALIGSHASIPVRTTRVAEASSRPSGRLRLTRRGRVVFTTLAAIPLVVAVAVVGLSAGGAAANNAASATSFTYVTVDPGESLWQLAESIAPDADPRDVIAEIMNLNQLRTSGVEPGQRLAVPQRYVAE
ncbi:MAG TPA: LysM peptidoglycan-binding domain-containing protein [Plantibacter sp.]|uniref:LysM peptidoglycan-binding domain-containing protein n=1 Tax=unclassified Plantibacter TaxID=2624265 RepID=UPI002C532E2F|nr:LysM peptidoglycan-binding domain-containing protein [Plantibacter sp.]